MAGGDNNHIIALSFKKLVSIKSIDFEYTFDSNKHSSKWYKTVQNMSMKKVMVFVDK